MERIARTVQINPDGVCQLFGFYSVQTALWAIRRGHPLPPDRSDWQIPGRSHLLAALDELRPEVHFDTGYDDDTSEPYTYGLALRFSAHATFFRLALAGDVSDGLTHQSYVVLVGADQSQTFHYYVGYHCIGANPWSPTPPVRGDGRQVTVRAPVTAADFYGIHPNWEELLPKLGLDFVLRQ